MREYLNLLDDVLQHGAQKSDRTGTGTLSVFGRQVRFDLSRGFPLLTTKKVHWKSVVHELLWFLDGGTNVRDLQKYNVRIWDEWANRKGELGPIYGAQWRKWNSSHIRDGKGKFIQNEKSIDQPYLGEWAVPAEDVEKKCDRISPTDQIKSVVENIKKNPDSRRHIVSAWNVSQIKEMRLPPCHILFQFYVSDGALSCQLYQRSADIFLGVPFNIASYSLLTLMVAQVCGLRPGEFVHTFGDLHLYLNHIKQAEMQLSRTPLSPPQVRIAPRENIFDFTFDDITLLEYAPHPPIPAPVAV